MRALQKLSAETFDVVVVGGGAHGATAAYYTAKAGYRTALIEKDDFCGGTSANSLKILHGGLRYLQHLNIKRMRESIIARREMMRLAPHLVQPLACMMPLYGHGMRGRWLMQTALFVNDCISWDRNKNLPENIHLPRGHILPSKKCLDILPGIDRKKLAGAAVWYDGLAVDTERLIMEYVLESVRLGAVAVNYVRASALTRDGDDAYRITLVDQLSGKEFETKAKVVINAAGPWFEQTVSGLGVPAKRQKWAVAVNLVSKKKLFHDYAVALEGLTEYQDKDAVLKRGKRLYFFVPWREYTMIGTEYEMTLDDPDNLEVKAGTLQKMLDGINGIYPSAQLKYDDICFYHAGMMPVQQESEHDNIQMEKNSSFGDHAAQGFGGVVSIRGVKFTTAPYIAMQLVNFIDKHLQTSKKARNLNNTDTCGSTETVGDGNYPRLAARYGRRAGRILSYMHGQDGDPWLDEKTELLKAEVRYLLQEEMACRLSDVVLRRTEIGTAQCPDRLLLEKVANFMGGLLAWDERRRQEEIEQVRRRYTPLRERVGV